MKKPSPFLSVVVHDVGDLGDDLALCAGYERGNWRNDQFADHIMEWIPEFALNYTEVNDIGAHNAVKMTRKAARIVYQTEKYGLRGEFGELFLHIAMRQVYDTVPAVSKIYYKSAVNKTVEGFDAVHVVNNNGDLELWIGETKFYNDLSRAIRDVIPEIVDHLETDYLRSEFMLIKNKIDPHWPEADSLSGLLEENVSLDEVFKRACIPILLTYDSNVVSKNHAIHDEYVDLLMSEIGSKYDDLRDKLEFQYRERFGCSLPLGVHIFLLPLENKKRLIATLDSCLKELQ
ncbi:HamA C-terminal domain-containing protein [Desulfoluna butyratoxydans]|uniref:Anti-bacteriophage protein A/HamA C-terminal domain-containing protein n=1 Tax=Desulfoluna butyratoxydans TaxID=231438 RepID=A0A4U8YLS7_9BACT|nr:DUF1837 domain-containing protein [Desulfoluna butyratoxydans]VFQ44537.1 protein of unknown function duf1837 [Desulfoluna butyratoxydans]